MSLFIIDLMGLFFYNKIGSIISIGDLPTTNIIEPIFIIKILFIILGIYFFVTYIRETDFLCLLIYLLAFACVIHFHQEFKTSKIKKILKRQKILLNG